MSPDIEPLQAFFVDALEVRIYATRDAMGQAAAQSVAQAMRDHLATQERVRMVFAAAPSQNELLAALAEDSNLDWDAVEAFHMDEYVGLAENAPQRFGTFLRQHLFDLVAPGRVEYLDGNASDLEQECLRYTGLLCEAPIEIVCGGIGENGHMAFNDPHVADFADLETVKPVSLDDVCRQQQVNDGAFARIEDVPRTALTVTMSGLLMSRAIFCVVPGPSKSKAVRDALRGPIGHHCPATALRQHPHSILYLDRQAAALL